MTYQLGPLTVAGVGEPLPDGWAVRLNPTFDEGYPWWSESTRLVLESMEPLDLAGKRVLDFGCGPYAILSLAAQAKGAHVTALDAVERIAAAARKQTDANVITHDDGAQYDVIFANVGDEAIVDSLRGRAPIVIGTAKSGEVI